MRQLPGRPADPAALQPSNATTIDRTLTFRETFGDYQRQMFLIDLRAAIRR